MVRAREHWCKGSTTDFDSVGFGSMPECSAKVDDRHYSTSFLKSKRFPERGKTDERSVLAHGIRSANIKLHRAVGVLAWLITKRSQVRILLERPRTCGCPPYMH